MDKKKVGIITLHTGFNYGTSLQAYAIKELVASAGYTPQLYWYKDSIIKGRDVRVKKMLTMFTRTIIRPKVLVNTVLTYKKSIIRKNALDNKEAFHTFTKDKLNVEKVGYSNLCRISKEDQHMAFVCGSDQIWNATSTNVDPIFYLRFAPKAKRISYAPSFGKSKVADFNRRIMRRYLSEFSHISVREDRGAEIVEELTGKEVPVVLDPTLAMDKTFWEGKIEKRKKEDYILFYFLDQPKEMVLSQLKQISEMYNLPVYVLSYQYEPFDTFENLKYVNAGPFEFVEYISNAKFVCTDSFHGAAFSVNMNVPFYVFGRNYGVSADQSSRLTSLLKKLGLGDRFVNSNIEINSESFKVDFTNSNELLEKERAFSKEYLQSALKAVEVQNKETQGKRI